MSDNTKGVIRSRKSK